MAQAPAPSFALHDVIRNGGDLLAIQAVLAGAGGSAPPDFIDDSGYAPIHYLAVSRNCKGPIPKLDILLAHYSRAPISWTVNSVLDVRDRRKNTVLHLAAKFKRYNLVKKLLELGGAEITHAQNEQGWFPTHFAADARGPTTRMLRNLIQHGSPVRYAYDGHVRTPVQVAASFCCLDALKVFREFDFSFKPHGGRSLFQLVIEAGDTEAALKCIEYLLELDKTDRNLLDPDSDSALLIAVRERCPGLLRAILEHENAVTSSDDPLHILAYSPELKAIECARLLLDRRYHQNDLEAVVRFVQKGGASGFVTALDICCHQRNVDMAQVILLATYAHSAKPGLAVNYWLEDHVLDRIYDLIPLSMMPVLQTSYAHQQTIQNGEMDFSVIHGIAHEPSRNPTRPLFHLTHHNPDVQEQVLLHPLTQLYLQHNWAKYVRLVFVSALLQFLILLNYVYAMASCNTTPDAHGVCENGRGGWFSALVSLVTVSILLLKECFQFWQAKRRLDYLMSMYNIAQVLFGVMAFISLMMALVGLEEGLWAVSVAGLLLAWVVAILQLKNLPQFGMYISILTQVAWKSVKILALFALPTFIVFSQVFQILIQQGSFQSLGQVGVGVKLFMMMVGELEFDETVGKLNQESGRYLVVLLVFALFAFIAGVVILNLLLAMAVDVTQKVERNAETEVARCQLEQIYLWETCHPLMRIRRGA